jgi:uncharacterized protein (DUF433 family)
MATATLSAAEIAVLLGDRLELFEAWRARLVTDDRILGGEPVFPKRRLAVRNIGGQVLKGVQAAELREEYPYLKDNDLEFAKVYTLAYPKR